MSAAAEVGSPRPPRGGDLLEWRVARLEEDRREMVQAVRSLVQIEESQKAILERLSRGSGTLDDHEGRIRRVEEVMPILRMTSRWVVSGVLAVFGMLGLSVYQLLQG